MGIARDKEGNNEFLGGSIGCPRGDAKGKGPLLKTPYHKYIHTIHTIHTLRIRVSSGSVAKSLTSSSTVV